MAIPARLEKHHPRPFFVTKATVPPD